MGKKCKTGDDVDFKKPGRSNLLDPTRDVIYRRKISNITKGVVKFNNPDILGELWNCGTDKSVGKRHFF